jgi:copper ion binding protein
MATAIDFTVNGMTCEHCVHAVTNAVQELPGVTAVTVSLDENSAHVEGDVLDQAAIVAAIAEEGYEAVPRS